MVQLTTDLNTPVCEFFFSRLTLYLKGLSRTSNYLVVYGLGMRMGSRGSVCTSEWQNSAFNDSVLETRAASLNNLAFSISSDFDLQRPLPATHTIPGSGSLDYLEQDMVTE